RLALHRLLDPRPDRSEHDGRRAMGRWILDRELSERQTPEAIHGDAYAEASFPDGDSGGEAHVLDTGRGRDAPSRQVDVSYADPGQPLADLGDRGGWSTGLCWDWLIDRQPGADHRDRQRPH